MIDLGQGGAKLYLPGGKSLYSRVDGVSRKYRLSKKSIKEVKQPFTYLGRTTKVELPDPSNAMCGPYHGPKKLKLYGKKDLKSHVVATLSPGRKIEVILRTGQWFLIKTPMGLNGWATNVNMYYSLFGFADSCVG